MSQSKIKINDKYVCGVKIKCDDGDNFPVVYGILAGDTILYNKDNVSLGLSYNFNNLLGLSKYYEVTGIGKCKDTSIYIPSKHNDGNGTYYVTEIDTYAFHNNTNIKQVTINGDSEGRIKTIPKGAFSGCTELQSFTLNASNTTLDQSIGKNSFYGCTNLCDVDVSSKLYSVGKNAFRYTNVLSSTKYIHNDFIYAGNKNNYIILFGPQYHQNPSVYTGKDITLPDTCKIIYQEAFKPLATHLKSVSLPKSVIQIGQDAFQRVDYISKGVYYGGGVDDWVKINFENRISNPLSISAFDDSSGWGQYLYVNENELVEEAVVSYAPQINNYAFVNCKSLNKITIGDGVSEVGDWAFYYCKNLKTVNFSSDSSHSIGDFAFANCSSLSTINIPDTIKKIGSSAFSECNKLTSVSYSGTVNQWAEIEFGNASSNPFQGLGGLHINGNAIMQLNLDKAKKVSNYAFSGCNSLTSIIIGNSVKSIGDYAFYDCNLLTSVVIPNSVTSIGESAFSSCLWLARVVIGDNVTSIGDGAFQYCTSLINIEIPDSVTSIGSSAFFNTGIQFTEYGNCKYLGNEDNPYLALIQGNNISSQHTIHKDTKVVAKLALADSSLTSITVDDNNQNYKSIDGNLYSKDGKTLIQYAIGKTATQFTIPETVTSIGDYAFYYCDLLTSVTIGKSVKSIGDWAFRYCDKLTSIVIPDSVTSIGSSAFADCDSLTRIEIPNSVTSIGDYAFSNCKLLESIKFSGTREQWHSIEINDSISSFVKWIECSDGTINLFE